MVLGERGKEDEYQEKLEMWKHMWEGCRIYREGKGSWEETYGLVLGNKEWENGR